MSGKMGGPQIKVVAHRGAWKKNQLPQNSISAMQQAVKLRLGGTEFDIHMTADDSLVLNHDREYNGLDINKSTWSELSGFRLSNNENLPTLRKFLAAGLVNNRSTRLICEIKPSGSGRERARYSAEKTVGTVRDMKAEKMVSFISFDIEICKRISELDPAADVQYLNGNLSPSELKAIGINGIDYNISVFKKNPGWIKEAKEAGMVLNVWTVNKEEDIEWAIDQGFDLITTDEPELVSEIISRKSKINSID
jgi:glycerophosphoryl diester phosphodiesterase